MADLWKSCSCTFCILATLYCSCRYRGLLLACHNTVKHLYIISERLQERNLICMGKQEVCEIIVFVGNTGKQKMTPTGIINKQKVTLMPVCKWLSRHFYIVNRMPNESEKITLLWRPCVSIHDLASMGKLLIGFSLILMYKFLTNSCEVRSSFVEMERHALNKMLPVFLHFSSVWIKLEHISLKCTELLWVLWKSVEWKLHFT